MHTSCRTYSFFFYLQRKLVWLKRENSRGSCKPAPGWNSSSKINPLPSSLERLEMKLFPEDQRIRTPRYINICASKDKNFSQNFTAPQKLRSDFKEPFAPLASRSLVMSFRVKSPCVIFSYWRGSKSSRRNFNLRSEHEKRRVRVQK